jgi:hypothetical protein
MDANTQMLMEQLNDLELKYRDKLETFWKHMFAGCSGFVAVVVPLMTKIGMSGGVKVCIFGAVVSSLICILSLIPLLYCSVRWHKELFEHGRKVIKGETSEIEFSPAGETRLERGCMVISILSIVIALGCLGGACLFA